MLPNTLFLQTTLGRTRARLTLPPQDVIISNHNPEGFAKKRKVVQEIKSKQKSRPSRGKTFPSLPATQDLLARLESYAEEGEKDNKGDGESDGYSTDSMEEEIQRIRRWTVVRRNLGHDCMNEKSLLAHIREQTDAVPANLVNVNDVGKEKDTPSKRSSKRMSELAKRMSKTP